MYLTDWDAVSFLKKAGENLVKSNNLTEEGERKTGLIFVKENESKDGFLLDNRDNNSLVRTFEY